MALHTIALLLLSLMAIRQVQCVNVKWTGNNDPNLPEAAKVPRSQKYWDDNNIERPDYAKTDAEVWFEVYKEKIISGIGKGDGNVNGLKEESDGKSILIIITFFVALWAIIIKFGMTKSGFVRGNRLGSSGSPTNLTFRKNQGDGLELEEKARRARLAKFEASAKTD